MLSKNIHFFFCRNFWSNLQNIQLSPKELLDVKTQISSIIHWSHFSPAQTPWFLLAKTQFCSTLSNYSPSDCNTIAKSIPKSLKSTPKHFVSQNPSKHRNKCIMLQHSKVISLYQLFRFFFNLLINWSILDFKKN